MKLYIDGLFYKGSGIGRYYESLTKEFAKRGLKIYTCVPNNLRNDFEKDFSNIPNLEPIFVDYEKFSVKGFLKQSKILKKLENEVSLFFYPHVNLPYYIPKNTVITIHDLRPLTQFWDRNEIKRRIFIFYLKRAFKHSTKIVTVSNTVAKELKQNFKWLDKDIEAIYNFIDDKFTNYNQQNKRIIDKPYLLFIGNRKKHKNLELLIKAFAKIDDKIPHCLVIAGAKDEDKRKDEIDVLIKKLNIQNRIIQLIKPGDETIINLYSFADLFVFPSLFEGFGLPPLEAVSFGCPVILSDIPILREIFGEAGFYFNPHNEEDLANAILKVISDKKFKIGLLEKQRERLKIFDKDKIIEQYISLFERITGKKL
jgi:glycosyltransferase involved in cell wall biosynthesis